MFLKLPKARNPKPIMAETTADGTLRPRGGKYYQPYYKTLRTDKIANWNGGKRFLNRKERKNIKEALKNPDNLDIL